MNVVKKGLAFGMALMMAGSMAACAGGDTTWAAKAGDLTVPAGVYISQVMNAYYTVAAELPQDTKDPLKEQIDGVLASDKMISDAKANLNKFIAVEQKFNELGLTMSDADTTLVNQMADFAQQLVGEQAVYRLDEGGMGSEDFASYTYELPCAYLLLGAGTPNENPLYGKPMHNEKVVFNEDVLPLGAALHTWCALNWLSQ